MRVFLAKKMNTITEWAWKGRYAEYIKPIHAADEEKISTAIIGMDLDDAVKYIHEKYKNVTIRHMNSGDDYNLDERRERCNVWTDKTTNKVVRAEWF